MTKHNSESYLVSAKYDLNINQGAKIVTWYRVVEKLLRDLKPELTRHKLTGGPERFESGRIKAGCGIKLCVALESLRSATRL